MSASYSIATAVDADFDEAFRQVARVAMCPSITDTSSLHSYATCLIVSHALQIIGQYLLASAIVALATFLSGLLVLPSLAGREVHDKTAAAITGLSNAISR